MSERIYATEITSEGNTMCVRVTAQMLDARINLGVVVETQAAFSRFTRSGSEGNRIGPRRGALTSPRQQRLVQARSSSN
jgi:hypothetical protein